MCVFPNVRSRTCWPCVGIDRNADTRLRRISVHQNRDPAATKLFYERRWTLWVSERKLLYFSSCKLSSRLKHKGNYVKTCLKILNADSRKASFLTPASLIVICSSFSVYNCLEIDENRRWERSLKVFKQHFDYHCVSVFVLPQLLILYTHYGNFLTLSQFRKKIQGKVILNLRLFSTESTRFYLGWLDAAFGIPPAFACFYTSK